MLSHFFVRKPRVTRDALVFCRWHDEVPDTWKLVVVSLLLVLSQFWMVQGILGNAIVGCYAKVTHSSRWMPMPGVTVKLWCLDFTPVILTLCVLFQWFTAMSRVFKDDDFIDRNYMKNYLRINIFLLTAKAACDQRTWTRCKSHERPKMNVEPPRKQRRAMWEKGCNQHVVLWAEILIAVTVESLHTTYYAFKSPCFVATPWLKLKKSHWTHRYFEVVQYVFDSEQCFYAP